MKDKILAGNMIIYIEKRISANFNSDVIIDEFKIFKCIILSLQNSLPRSTTELPLFLLLKMC